MKIRILLFAFLIASPAFAADPAAKPAAQPPAAQAPAEPEDCVGKARLRGLIFSQDGAEIQKTDEAMLDLVADAIKTRCAGKTITIEGHTAKSENAAQSQKLSERRAEAVEKYLIAKGVPASQLKVVGYGSSRPISTDPSAEGQKMNRRVTLVAN
jgi:OOP family OmpA-OmpF porin